MDTQEHMLLEKVTIFSAEEGKKLKKRLEEEQRVQRRKQKRKMDRDAR